MGHGVRPRSTSRGACFAKGPAALQAYANEPPCLVAYLLTFYIPNMEGVVCPRLALVHAGCSQQSCTLSLLLGFWVEVILIARKLGEDNWSADTEQPFQYDH